MTYSINGSELLLQPTRGDWIASDPIGRDEKKAYLVNVTAETKEMMKRAQMVEDLGGKYVMIDIVKDEQLFVSKHEIPDNEKQYFEWRIPPGALFVICIGIYKINIVKHFRPSLKSALASLYF